MRRDAATLLKLGAVAGFFTVALGAFGAHGLEGRISAAQLGWWTKGVEYQGLHAVALLTCGAIALHLPSQALRVAGWAFVAGMVLFSGSLYLLALTGERWLGAVTPFGGTAFLIGWAALVVAAHRATRGP